MAVSENLPKPKVAERNTSDLVKPAVSGWLGTALEFMDFQLYSLAAALVFSKIFFPNASPAVAVIASMTTYGSGTCPGRSAPGTSAGSATRSAAPRSCSTRSP